MINTVRNTVRNTIRQTVRLGANLNQFFARYFNKAVAFLELANIAYLADTVNDQTRTNSATQVVDSDNAAEMWIDAASAIGDLDSMTIVEDDGVEVSASYAYETNQTINGTAGRDGYRVTFPASKNVSDLKLLDASDNVIAEYLMDEAVGIITFNRLINNSYAIGHGELVNATLPDARVEVLDRANVQDALGYSVGENLAYWSEEFDEISGSGLKTWGLSNVNVSASVETAIKGKSYEVESSGVGTVPHLIFQYFSVVSGDLAIMQLFIKKGNNNFFQLFLGGAPLAVGSPKVNIDLNLGLITSEVGFTNPTVLESLEDNWYKVTVYKTATSAGNATIGLLPIPESTTARASAYEANGESFIISAVIFSKTTPVSNYYKTELNPIVADTLIPINPVTPTLDIFGNTPTYTGTAGKHLKLTKQNAIEGDGSATVTFADLPTYDAVTAIKDGTPDTDISGEFSGAVWTPANGSLYNDVIFSNAGTNVARFRLNEYDADSSPVSINFYDSLNSGATATGTSFTVGSGGLLQYQDGLSQNFEKGFATITANDTKYPKLENDSGYAGLTGAEPGYTEYPPNNDASEQHVQAIASKEFIDKNPDSVFFTGNTPNDVLISDIVNGTDIEINKNGNVITDIKIKQ